MEDELESRPRGPVVEASQLRLRTLARRARLPRQRGGRGGLASDHGAWERARAGAVSGASLVATASVRALEMGAT